MDLRTEIESKLEMTEAQLLIEFAHNTEMYQTPPSDDVAKAQGQNRFEQHFETFKQIVCASTVRDGLDGSTIALAVAIAELLASRFGLSVVPTITALLIKRGVRGMCGWEE